ncbi:MAG: hypothetical protein IMZ52_09550 [Actinobacteria bacterium]|nr:hypothetical protein [Actinomycetota bacterium]
MTKRKIKNYHCIYCGKVELDVKSITDHVFKVHGGFGADTEFKNPYAQTTGRKAIHNQDIEYIIKRSPSEFRRELRVIRDSFKTLVEYDFYFKTRKQQIFNMRYDKIGTGKFAKRIKKQVTIGDNTIIKEMRHFDRCVYRMRGALAKQKSKEIIEYGELKKRIAQDLGVTPYENVEDIFRERQTLDLSVDKCPNCGCKKFEHAAYSNDYGFEIYCSKCGMVINEY